MHLETLLQKIRKHENCLQDIENGFQAVLASGDLTNFQIARVEDIMNRLDLCQWRMAKMGDELEEMLPETPLTPPFDVDGSVVPE